MFGDQQELGVITAAHAGTRRSALTAGVRRRELLRVYTGVYIDAARRDDPLVQARAACAAIPGGIVIGDLALAVTLGWPWRSGIIDMVAPRRDLRAGSVRCRRAMLDPQWWVDVDGARVATPAFAATYLAGEDDGAALDRFLREGGSMADVREALASMERWRGQRTRRTVVHDARDEPWSAAERRLHRVLRDAGISGWKSNYRVVTQAGAFYLDAGFPGQRLGLEADGYEFHSSRDAFGRDRARHNALLLAGWRELHFTWDMLADADAVVRDVRCALGEGAVGGVGGYSAGRCTGGC